MPKEKSSDEGQRLYTYLENINTSIQELAQAIRAGNRLWDIEDIGHYMNYKSDGPVHKAIKEPDFPRPIITATDGKRWKPAEVRAWQEKRRG